jgi:hypothetical protein
LHGTLVADVEGDRQGRTALGGDQGGGLGGGALVEVEDADRCAAPGKLNRARPADAAAGTGDQSGLALEAGYDSASWLAQTTL